MPDYFGALALALDTILWASCFALAGSLNAAFAWSFRMVEENTFCGCLLLAAVADRCACSKMPSWFSVFTDCSDMISICSGACITRECR